MQYLTSCEQRGDTTTKIMRNVALNHVRINRYCAMMVKNGLLCYEPEDDIYETTPKGQCVSYACDELFQYLRPVSDMVEKYRIHPLVVEK